MRAQVIAASGSLASFIASVAVPIAFPHVEPWVGYALLAFAGCLAALAVGLWIPHRKGGESGGVTQTSHGPHSPNFGSVGRDVNIYAHPPAQEPTHTMPSWARERGLATYGIHDRKQCPDTPVWWAIHRIAARIGENNSAEGYPDARRQLRQAAREGLEIWGQEQIPPIEMHDVHKHRTVWSPIPATYWQDFMLAITAANEIQEDAPHTCEEASPNTPLGRYWNLRVRKEEINRRWRKPEPPPSIPSIKTGWSKGK
jgi:hypothetical protein